jgi:hypothetical protein
MYRYVLRHFIIFKSLPANIFICFLPDFCRVKSQIFTKICVFIFVQTRAELNKWVVHHTLSPRAESLSEYGREGMEAIRGFYRKLADDEGMVQFRANHPSKFIFCLSM